MQVRTRHTPTFGVARLLLAPGEAIQAGYDAMLATSYGMGLVVGARSGSRGPKQATFTAPAEGGWVDLAPALPGEVYTVDLDGTSGWCVARGSCLAMAGTLRADPAWPGFRPMFGADSGFLDHLSGHGTAVLNSCGALDVVNLDAGQAITVDPGSLVAFTDVVQSRLRAASQTIHQSMRTGEGLLLDLAGPGQLLTQTRKALTMAAGHHR